jgi:hypothetical protein
MRQQAFQAVPLKGTPPRPERAGTDAPCPAVGELVRARGQRGDPRGPLAARERLDVELAYNRVSK